jgi:diguanylate cyclase (GGDEF)-like protein
VAVLQQATQMILSSVDVETVLHHILLVVRNYFGASRAAVYLVESTGNELYCRAQSGYAQEVSDKRIRLGKDSVAGWAAFTRAPLYISDVANETRHKVEDRNIQSVLALPLLVRERPVGVLEIGSEQTDAFSNNDIGLLSVFAGQAAIALENSRLYFTDLRRMRQIEIINLIARTAAASHDTQQFYSMLADLLSDTFEDTFIGVVLCSSEGHLSVAASSGAVAPGIARLAASRQKGVISEAFSHKSLIVVNDIGNRPGWSACFAGTGSELCAPLVSLGEVLGAIVLAHKQENFFSGDDRAIAQAAADVCATAVRNVQLSEELRRVANMDALTGVFNQQYFHTVLAQELQRARRHKKEFGLLMLDVHDFRKINSRFGLEAGDALLRQLADALKAALRTNDVVCRYFSDRFVLLLPEIKPEGMEAVQEKLRRSLAALEVKSAEDSCAVSAAWASLHFPQDNGEELELTKLLLGRVEKEKQQSSGTSA